MKPRTRYISILVVAAVTALTLLFFKNEVENAADNRPFPQEEYTEQVNERAGQGVRNNRESKSLAEQSKQVVADSAMKAFLTFLAKDSVQDISFSGKIVDQHDEPVPNVMIEYIGSRSILASGSGPGQIVSGDDGRFTISDAKGEGLRIIKLSKLGYQFPNMETLDMPRDGAEPGTTWDMFTYDSPYLVEAWNIERYPKTVNARNRLLRFVPDRKIKSISLGEKSAKVLAGEGTGDISFYYQQNTDGWRLELLSAGGVIASNDYFLYNAPADGYEKKIVVAGRGRNSETGNYYFKSDSSGYYGALQLTVSPSGRPDRAHLHLSYTINLEGDSNLTVKQIDKLN